MIRQILALGWKNIWRNPTRSAVVIIAVLMGLWAGIFMSAFFNGLAQGYLQNQLEMSVGHLQVSHPEFEDQMLPQYGISGAASLADSLAAFPFVTGLRAESLTGGLAQSARGSYGTTLHGIEASDNSAHPAARYMEEGDMPGPDMRNPVAVGDALADRLGIGLKSRIVFSFQDVNGEITAGAFRVSGIFDSPNEQYDQSNVFVNRDDLNRLLGEENLVHRITLMADDFGRAPHYRDRLAEALPDLRVRSWGEIAPELEYVYSAMDISLYVTMIIIILALVFSIINTMLMAILERTKELGMLMAVGMNRARIFGMILAETFFLTMTGVPLGLLLSWGTVSVLSDKGIDLSAFAEGLNEYGMGTVIHPELQAAYYLNIALMVAAAALLSALYPAWKTLKLKPVEAIHKL